MTQQKYYSTTFQSFWRGYINEKGISEPEVSLPLKYSDFIIHRSFKENSDKARTEYAKYTREIYFNNFKSFLKFFKENPQQNLKSILNSNQYRLLAYEALKYGGQKSENLKELQRLLNFLDLEINDIKPFRIFDKSNSIN